MTPDTPPSSVLVVGDWHGNAAWASGATLRLPELLPDSPRLILHTGDFGVWPGKRGQEYLDMVTRELRRADAHLWFVDGNHEDHDRLDRVPRNPDSTGRVTDRILHLPRGYRWQWHDRTWLALGGAASVDRAGRTPGRDWWHQEEITDAQADAVVSAGPADVMLTHDCPSSVQMDLPVPPHWWDLERAEEHRQLLQRVVDKVTPRHLIHGHYHHAHATEAPQPYGPLTVVGMDCDGALPGNWGVLDVSSMTWLTDHVTR